MNKERGIFIINKAESTLLKDDIEIDNTLMRYIDLLINGIVDLEKWEFIIEDWKAGDPQDKPHYKLYLTSTSGPGDSCAKEKLNTLQNHPEIGNTGELLKKELGENEASWYGGINIPYTGFEDYEPVTGIVRIVFSGANEAVDLGIVLDMLRAYKYICDQVCKNATYHYDLSKLKQNQLCKYLMDEKKMH